MHRTRIDFLFFLGAYRQAYGVAADREWASREHTRACFPCQLTFAEVLFH